MILSQISLSPRDISKEEIHDEYGIHKLVYDLFPGNSRDFLYQEMPGDRALRKILVLSQNTPSNNKNLNIRSKDLPMSYLDWSEYMFKVRLNPVRNVKGFKNKKPVIGREELLDWFCGRSQQWGFSPYRDNLEVSEVGSISFKSKGNNLRFHQAMFSGILKVEDKTLFRESFTKGLGRGKAFGFGLLQLKPLN